MRLIKSVKTFITALSGSYDETVWRIDKRQYPMVVEAPYVKPVKN